MYQRVFGLSGVKGQFPVRHFCIPQQRTTYQNVAFGEHFIVVQTIFSLS
jgi:hypothetical protein